MEDMEDNDMEMKGTLILTWEGTIGLHCKGVILLILDGSIRKDGRDAMIFLRKQSVNRT